MSDVQAKATKKYLNKLKRKNWKRVNLLVPHDGVKQLKMFASSLRIRKSAEIRELIKNTPVEELDNLRELPEMVDIFKDIDRVR